MRAASALRPALGFLVGECRGGTRRYSVASGSVVFVRHKTRDVDLVNEIFGGIDEYEPPTALASALRGPLRILDAGGNIGMFGAFALRRWTVREMTSFEPDPENATVLEATIVANHATQRWHVSRAAVSNRGGATPFVPGRLAESRRALPGEPGIEVPTVDLFSDGHRVDLLKLDVEGSEWAILEDPRLASLDARVIVMEWHSLWAPQPDAHGAALHLLTRAGYEIHLDRVHPPLGHTGLVWAGRR